MNTVYTIGHSTRSFDELVSLLHHYKIDYLIDVRSIPRSRTNPQFNEEMMHSTMQHAGITYTHIAKLGGLRPTNKDSINDGWRNKSFRGYADYMQTSDFEDGLAELLTLATNHTVAIMCAETVPWRCHRSMIGDALLLRGYDVNDIFDENKVQPETLTSFASVDGTTITYPAK